MSDVVLVEVADRVATITLNRPEARNALSRELLRAAPAAIAECDASDEVDVLILTGADPAFCAGLDLKELGGDGGDKGSSSSMAAPREKRSGPFPARTKPMIGAVNGAAITGGFELALACDFLIASDRARFADTHARVGVQPGWGLTVLLPQAIGVRRAREMSATGNFVDAPTALAWGLVNHVVPHEELLPFTRALAADIVGNDPAGVQQIFATYAAGAMLAAGEAWDLETTNARDWLRGGGGAPEEIARRRQAIIDRGRAQSGGA